MRSILRHRPSPAMVIACIALAVALGGTSYAAIKLPKNSVGTEQLKKNAITSPKVRNNTITGADVLESSLGRVPLAAGATNASHATDADRATNATTAGTANEAFSRYHEGPISLPTNGDSPILALYIPITGNFVVTAKLNTVNVSGTASSADSCALLASNGLTFDRDYSYFHVDGNGKETVNLQLVSQFTVSPAQVGLYCSDGGVGDVQANLIRITAVQVAELTYTVDTLRR